MRKVKIILLMLFLVTLSFALDMSRSDFDQRIDGEGGYQEIVFKNSSDKAIRYKFTVAKGTNRKDMSQWVKLYPKVMTIPPLEERTLKIYGKSPEEATKGEYSFYLNIKELVVPILKAEKEGMISATSIVSFVPSIEMVGYVGETDYEKTIKFENIKFIKEGKKEYILAKLKNEGEIGANLVLRFIGMNNFTLDEKWLGRIKRNTSQNIKLELRTDYNIKEIKKLIIYDANSLDKKTIKEIKI